MKYTKDLVSVIIPSYRRSDMLVRAVDSVLAQTYEHIECVVVNDNTPGDEYSLKLYKMIEKYKDDERFVFLEQPVHKNGAAARNYGADRSHGEFVAFLDDDDWWKPEKVKKQVEFMRSQGGRCGLVSTLLDIYKGDKFVRSSNAYPSGRVFLGILAREVRVTTSTVLADHEAFDDIGGFDDNMIRHQEIQMLTEFTYKYELGVLKESLTCRDVSTTDNQPDPVKLRKIKGDLFRSVGHIMDSMTAAERRYVKAMHMFELAYIEAKHHMYLRAAADSLYLLTSGKAFMGSVKRIIERLVK